jgi:hypothetical protein
VQWVAVESAGKGITMIEDGHDLGLLLALKHLLQRLEQKGMMSYQEVQRMLDDALGEIKRLRVEDDLTPAVAEDAIKVISGLYYDE